MHSPPRLFVHEHAHHGANYYYRVEVPVRVASDIYKIDACKGAMWEAKGEDDFKAYLMGIAVQDVALFFATSGIGTERTVRALAKMPPYELNGEKFSSPIVLSDLDDNLDFVHPFNPQFRTLGTRMPDGTPLAELATHEDKSIYVRLEATGEQVKAWTHGVDGFDVLRNERGMRSQARMLRLSHGCSFPTERLRKYYVDNYGLANTFVFPNSVIFEDYPKINLAKQSGVVKVLWQGGASHYQDLFPLRRTLGEAAKRFPEIRWIFWTDKMYEWVTEEIPKEKTEWHSWVPYAAYKIKLAAMDFDIALAPVVDNVFNQGKSAIKWYEAAALNEPKPILASYAPPYSDEVVDGDTGMLFKMPASHDEICTPFLDRLEALVRDVQLRERIAQRGKEWVRENREARVTVPKWWDWVQGTHREWSSGRLSRTRRASRVRGVLPPPILGTR